jgi:hypothetical protein
MALKAARALCNERLEQMHQLKEKLDAANAKNEETAAALEAERTAHTETTAQLASTEAEVGAARDVEADLQRYLDDAREANGLLSSSLATKISQLAESQAQLEAVHEENAKLKAQLAAAQAATSIKVEAAEEPMVVIYQIEAAEGPAVVVHQIEEAAEGPVVVVYQAEAAEEPAVVSSEAVGMQVLEASQGNEATVGEIIEVPQHPAAPLMPGDTMVMVSRKASGVACHMSALECEPQHAGPEVHVDVSVSVRVGCLPLPSYRKLLAWGSRHLLRRSRSGRTDGSGPDDVSSDRSQTVDKESETATP